MFSPCTPYLAGKIDGMARRRRRCPYEAGTQAAVEWAEGYAVGLGVP